MAKLYSAQIGNLKLIIIRKECYWILLLLELDWYAAEQKTDRNQICLPGTYNRFYLGIDDIFSKHKILLLYTRIFSSLGSRQVTSNIPKFTKLLF